MRQRAKQGHAGAEQGGRAGELHAVRHPHDVVLVHRDGSRVPPKGQLAPVVLELAVVGQVDPVFLLRTPTTVLLHAPLAARATSAGVHEAPHAHAIPDRVPGHRLPNGVHDAYDLMPRHHGKVVVDGPLRPKLVQVRVAYPAELDLDVHVVRPQARRSMVAFRTIPDVSAATSACTVRGISPLDDHHLGVSERSPYPGWVPRLKKCKRTDPELEMRNWRGLKNSQGRCITLFQLETEVALHARIVSTNASLRTHSQRQLVVIIEQRLNPQLFFSSSSSCW